MARYPGYRIEPAAAGIDPQQHKVVIVGAGPVGLAMAADLALRGVRSVLLDDSDAVSTGSRAICWSKRTLEIFGRLGIGRRMVERGVTWQHGRVFLGSRELYSFNLLPEGDHAYPAFINLAQCEVEQMLVDRVIDLGMTEIRWLNRVVAVERQASGALVTVEAQGTNYRIAADWLLAADGARSQVRRCLGLDFKGKVFEDRFLIADIRMPPAEGRADFPTERWFWFDPPFHPGQSALLHRQPDNVWRIDLQLGWDADPDLEKQPERVIPRLRAMLGPDRPFELDWVSVYTFQCRRLERFRHGPVIFIGDSAHQVSPFGARGGNGGIQDIDNLGWKLALVLCGKAPEALIDTYDDERGQGADENILNSTRSTEFLTPKGLASRAFRDAALSLSAKYPFARALVNSGRLSRPAVLTGSPLNTSDRDDFDSPLGPGAPAADAPVTLAGQACWLLDLLGDRFVALLAAPDGIPPALLRDLTALSRNGVRILVLAPEAPEADAIGDPHGVIAERYDIGAGGFILFRPDQHIAARFRVFDRREVEAALMRALGHTAPAFPETGA
jgi:3-(3-hydroxy-phenyl)propionate hydroxylase